jgi:hypothetical protein
MASGFASLFHRGAAAINTGSAGGAAASDAANSAADSASNAAANSMAPQPAAAGGPSSAPQGSAGAMVRVVSLTSETTSIDTSSIPSDQFEIPADWKLEPQKQVERSGAPRCPTATR